MKPEDLRSQSADEAADKNVIPSMIVRQQRIQLNANSARAHSDLAQSSIANHHHLCHQAPKNSSTNKEANNSEPQIQCGEQQNQSLQFDQNGLVLPKKVLHHPISSAQPIIKDLNREIKFNQKQGKNVLDKKSELKRALEKLEESKRKKEAEQERLNRRTSLELRLEERFEQIAKVEKNNNNNNSTGSSDNKRELC